MHVDPPLPRHLLVADVLSSGASQDPSPYDVAGGQHPFRFRNVRCGCYLINFTPTVGRNTTYDGTLRVECDSSGRRASGDLYQRGTIVLHRPPPPKIVLFPPPKPGAGIPIFPRLRYRYYLIVTQILENWTASANFTLGFERWRFNRLGRGPRRWTNEGEFTAVMSWMPAPADFPSSADYMAGDVKDVNGTVIGRLSMGWISPYLRRATVEIDRVPQAEAPLSNGAGVDWKAIGDAIGWQLTLNESNANVTEPSGEFWSSAECHSAMLTMRDSVDLDSEWIYHILCVRQLDGTSPRGKMYDASATDSNRVPREGCVIASHWVVPDTAEWGLAKGLRFGSVGSAYYRTAVHETAHAMGLLHNTGNNGFMNTTEAIAATGTLANPFPSNILWSFAENDLRRLRHLPDIFVRPGGIPFSVSGTPSGPPDSVADIDGVELEVAPLLEVVPIGAPVRINISLVNTGETAVEAPADIGLGYGFVRGEVVGPSDDVRTFSPLVQCADSAPHTALDPGSRISNSLTLLRGGEGALFPAPGLYTIRIEVQWDINGVDVAARGSTTVMVSSVQNESHGVAARHVLSTPDALLTLVLGGDHLEEGIAAIHAALQDSILRPHFAVVEAKRLATRFGKRAANLKAAAELIDGDTVMSPAEIIRIARIVAGSSDRGAAKSLAKHLKSKASDHSMQEEENGLLESL